MGWERRKNGGLYYLRPVKVNGKVRKIYYGPGERGRAAEHAYEARRAELTRLQQETERQRREENALMATVEAPLVSFEGAVTDLVEAVLESAGYWRPKQWVWRKRRVHD